MDGAEFLFKVFEKYGWVGVMAAFIAIDKFVIPWWRKNHSKKWVSWTELQSQIKGNADTIAEVKNKLGKHLEEEAEEDIMVAKLQTDHDNLKEKVETENNHVFSQLKSLHEKIDAKFDTLTRILLEKKA